ncbi:FAD-dependent oxidoreductase [Planctomycetes bacterium K23_9]|uniref:Soluble pyridine nucleotide transhydrogenase n=1 Tax=Stieleria marina TaxID=1930275 RepID=A0A517NZD4_9BACT|nr:soluble pyridine nucleotide transhydrogenase [Planctomycetes bacterium K23_9]
MKLIRTSIGLLIAFCAISQQASAAEIFVETESFADRGGWKLDTQFIQQMGSPYLLAHGLGKPVDDASTEFEVPQSGQYRVWVRTIDWVARWEAKGAPGKFQIAIDGKPLSETFGTQGAEWSWHDGGLVDLAQGSRKLTLKDLTGFDGRCDCIYFTTDQDATPPAEQGVLSDWRRKQLDLPETPATRGPYDLVVIGGGYAGMGAAISGARMGCRVALVQDRPVLGGNGSSEVRVWAMGNIRRGKFPRIGEIVEEFSDHATKSPGSYEEFGDDLKEQTVLAEPNIDLLLNHHAHAVELDGSKIESVFAFDTRSGQEVQILGNLFADCTGHGWIGNWAKAELEMTETGRMGMSNMWAWDEEAAPTDFPQTPWALDLDMADFPYPRDHHGQWFWESGFDKDALGSAEAIRDWNLRAVYGAFNAMKNRDGADKHKNAILTWVAYVGGPRESRRLMGDVVLTQEDVVAKRDFPDGCVPTTWSIDLHYPKEQYAKKYADNPFISVAVHDRRVDRSYGYPVPYRCFYSRNIDNLFMAGRNISVTHEALGTVRVMKTCGMMGEVVGKAASLCALNSCNPRDVYESHLDALLELLKLPGKAHRSTPSAQIIIPDDILPMAGPQGPMSGKDPKKEDGIVLDDKDATLRGNWTSGTGLKNYVGWSYQYASPKSKSSATFIMKFKEPGKYKVQLYSQAHQNRATNTLVTVLADGKQTEHRVNQREKSPNDILTVTEVDTGDGNRVNVTISTEGADGNVHVDAVRLLKVQ